MCFVFLFFSITGLNVDSICFVHSLHVFIYSTCISILNTHFSDYNNETVRYDVFFFISCSCVIDIYWSKWILLFAIIRDSIVEENCIAFILILSRSYVKYNEDDKTVVLHTKYSRIIMVAIEWNKIIINGLLGFRSISFHFSQIIPHQNEIQTYVPFVIVISVKIRRKKQYSIWYFSSQRNFLNEMLANEQYNVIVLFQFSWLKHHYFYFLSFGKSFQRFFQSEQRSNQLSFLYMYNCSLNDSNIYHRNYWKKTF